MLVLGGLGGRVDQGLSQIHHLYGVLNDESLLVGKMYLLSEQSVSFVLQKGPNKIRCRSQEGKGEKIFTENVGILPVGAPASVSTKGLEWDVEDWKTEFGGQISTSNHIKADVIEVLTNERVLFTIELAADLCADE